MSNNKVTDIQEIQVSRSIGYLIGWFFFTPMPASIHLSIHPSNKPCTFRSQHLRRLPKLIILDLNGNGVSETEDYRLYCIFYLRKLKVICAHCAPALVGTHADVLVN